MTTVADELITEVLKDVTNKTPMNESDTSGYEEKEPETDSEPPRRQYSATKTWKLHNYIQLARRIQADSSLIGRLLCTTSYVYTNHSADIIALVLHCTDPCDEQTAKSIVTFHRMCILIFLRLWAEDEDQNKSFLVHHVPHKTRKLQANAERHYRTSQQAQVVQIAETRTEVPIGGATNPLRTTIAYSYIGEPVEWQPPSTYPLVTRRMPLHAADRYFALLTFLARGSVRQAMFVRKTSPDTTKQLDTEDKRCSLRDRVSACNKHFEHLRKRFGDPQKLMSWSGVFETDKKPSMHVACGERFAFLPEHQCSLYRNQAKNISSPRSRSPRRKKFTNPYIF